MNYSPVYLDTDGFVASLRPYTRIERLVRWAGKVFSIRALAQHHERPRPLGVALSSAHAPNVVTIRIGG